MTNDAIKVAIAESMGWTFGKPTFGHDNKWSVHFGNPGFEFDSEWAGQPPPFEDCYKDYSEIPNYPESLDACREFELSLNQHRAEAYAVYLTEVENLVNQFTPHACPTWSALFRLSTATPLQRCQAYLMTIGKWIE